MKIMFPDFNNSLINLTASIKKRFGGKSSFPSIKEVDDRIKDKKHIVVILLDGLGMSILERNLSEYSFLRRHLVKEMTSVFPPTTVAATNVMLQGKLPGVTGWFGWQQYFKTLDKNVVMFSNRDYYTNEKVNELEKNKHVLYHEFGYDFDCEYETLFPSFRIGGYDTIKDMFRRVLKITESDNETYTYCYWENPDETCHEKGCYNQYVKNVLIELDKELELLANKKNNDTEVIVIADHGHVDIKWIKLSEYPDLMSLVIHRPANEARSTVFYVSDKDKFRELFNKYFKDNFILYSKEEFINTGMIGNNTDMVDQFLGDFIAVSVSSYAFSLNDDTTLKGLHAGLTDEEMRIPIIMF